MAPRRGIRRRATLRLVLDRVARALLWRLPPAGTDVANPRDTAPASPRPVTFLVWNAHAMGGTVRTVVRQASALAERGADVTIVSVLRHSTQTEAFFDLDPRVRHELLVDRVRLRHGRGPIVAVQRWLDARPTVLGHVSLGREAQASLLTDARVAVRVARTRGALVGTRMGLNLAIARFAHPAVRTVAQEHLALRHYDRDVRRAARRHLASVDVVACLTRTDADAYRATLPRGGPLVVVVPNAIPDEFPEPAPLDTTTVVAVGRLERGKGFHHLIDAFARVQADHPAWRLRIVGAGRSRDTLQQQIDANGLGDRVTLVGATDDVAGELRAASVFVSSSRFESFGLVILEALAAGVPVVAFACETGPRELLSDDHDALLVEPGDVPGLAAALSTVMSDAGLRRRLARTGRVSASRFTLTRVTDQWSDLLWMPTTLGSPRRTTASGDPWTRRAPRGGALRVGGLHGSAVITGQRTPSM